MIDASETFWKHHLIWYYNHPHGVITSSTTLLSVLLES